MEEKGLCLIVFMMGGRDRAGFCFFSDALEESVPDITKAFFEIVF
jgi:hypothetical protein